MRIHELEYEYFHSTKNEQAYLLLHGSGDGIRESYTQMLLQKLVARGDSALAVNFPYMTRHEKVTSGPELAEESSALHAAYDLLQKEGSMRVHIIGKSLGGIVVSRWLANNTSVEGVDVCIMGYALGEDGVVTAALCNRLKVVVQGEFDRFGSPDAIQAELRTHNVEGQVVAVPGADHSYRDPSDPSHQPPVFQEQAIDELLKRI